MDSGSTPVVGPRSAFAITASTVVGALQYLFGDPFASGALALVLFLFLADLVTGTACAIWSHTWNAGKLRQGAQKVLLWGAILLVSRALSRPVGVLGADAALQYMSSYMLIYMIAVDLVSVLRHLICFAALIGIDLPGLQWLIAIAQAWHPGQPIIPSPAPATPTAAPEPPSPFVPAPPPSAGTISKEKNP